MRYNFAKKDFHGICAFSKKKQLISRVFVRSFKKSNLRVLVRSLKKSNLNLRVTHVKKTKSHAS